MTTQKQEILSPHFPYLLQVLEGPLPPILCIAQAKKTCQEILVFLHDVVYTH